MKKLISILIPAYERPDYLRRSLEQIERQTFKDFEVIVTDDSITDAVEEFVRSQAFSFPFQYRRNRPALGTPRNWTAGMDLAAGEWIKILHDDDWLSGPDSLLQYAQAIRSDVDLIFGGYEAVYESTGQRENRTISVRKFAWIVQSPNRLFAKNLLGPPSVLLYRRTMLAGFDPRLKWIVDWEGYIRMLQTYRATYIPRILICMSYNATQVTRACIGNPEIEMPETLIYYQRQGDKTRSTWLLYDAWWRLLRNLSIRNEQQLNRYAGAAPAPSFLYNIVRHQGWLPPWCWKVGPLSKLGMFISFNLNR